jgi:cytochrome P450
VFFGTRRRSRRRILRGMTIAAETSRVEGGTQPARSAERFPNGPPARRKGLLHAVRYYLNFALDPIAFVGSRFQQFGDLYYVPNEAGPGLYVVRHPDHMRDVLVTHASSWTKTHSAFAQLSRFLGAGLLTTDGETWKRQRRMVQPAFAANRLSGYGAIMTEEAARTRDALRPGEVRDMSREMMDLTLRVVCRTLFGHEVTGETEAVGRAMTTFQDSVGMPDLLPRWVPTPGRRKLDAANAALDRIILGMVDERRREDARGAPVRPDLLGLLVSAVDVEGDGGRLDVREVRDQLVTLFLAGHETTSHALTWTLYLLSQHPAAERALHAELDRVLGGRDPRYEDLAALPYTEQVIDEAMRLYPPVYTVGRRAREDTEIGGYRVEEGSEAILWIYWTHRDPRWFPAPNVFRPERFSPEERAKLPRHAHLPFGAGPRACIGKVFAMIEARLLLATLVQRHRFELDRGQRVAVRPRITLNPRYGMKMRVRERS